MHVMAIRSPCCINGLERGLRALRKGAIGRDQEVVVRDVRTTIAPPRAGERVNLPGHAETLELIGESWGEAFTGRNCPKIADFARKTGGYIDGKTWHLLPRMGQTR